MKRKNGNLQGGTELEGSIRVPDDTVRIGPNIRVVSKGLFEQETLGETTIKSNCLLMLSTVIIVRTPRTSNRKIQLSEPVRPSNLSKVFIYNFLVKKKREGSIPKRRQNMKPNK